MLGRLLRLEESALSASEIEVVTCFAVREDLVVVVLRFFGLGVCGAFVMMSREGSQVELVVLENISVYRFCTWLGERKISSSESWISSTSMNDGCAACPESEAFLVVAFDVVEVLRLDFAFSFGLAVV